MPHRCPNKSPGEKPTSQSSRLLNLTTQLVLRGIMPRPILMTRSLVRGAARFCAISRWAKQGTSHTSDVPGKRMTLRGIMFEGEFSIVTG